MKNYGLNLYKEIAEQSSEDYVFGGFSQPCITNIEPEERIKYLPKGEVQRGKDDLMDCASRGAINILEAKFTWLIQNKKLSKENDKWLRDNGYVNNEVVEFSDAYTAILSNTTREGNSLKAPLQCINDFGLIPKKLLPLIPTMTFEEYHNPERVTPAIKKLGEEFIKRFQINYEKVYEVHYGELLKEDMLDVAGYAWDNPVNGVYPRTNATPNHCFVVWKLPKYSAFDNYIDQDGDFIKVLSEDYDLLDYGYRVKITKEIIPEPNWFITFIKSIFKK